MSSSTYHLWSKGTRVRVIRINELIDQYYVSRKYAEVSEPTVGEQLANDGRNLPISVRSASMTVMGQVDGRVIDQFSMTKGQAELVISEFQRSAIKAGFAYHGLTIV